MSVSHGGLWLPSCAVTCGSPTSPCQLCHRCHHCECQVQHPSITSIGVASNPEGNWILTPLHTVDYWNPIFHSALHSRSEGYHQINLEIPHQDVSKRIYFIHIFNTQKSQVGKQLCGVGGEATLLMESMLYFQTSKNRCLNTTSWIQVAICFGHCWFPDNSC